MTTPNWPYRRPAPRAEKPRKVRGGVKLDESLPAVPNDWARQRWLRLLEDLAPGAALVEGLEYAKQGQTRRMDLAPGRAEGLVQGRNPQSYQTAIRVATISNSDWDRVAKVLIEQPSVSAKLLSGELPAGIEDVFGPLGLRLFPGGGEDLRPSCTCAEARRAPAEWCKHACCLGLLTGQRLAGDPWLIFALRGMPREELLERMRQGRAVTGSACVYSPHVPGASDLKAPSVEESMERFWEPGATLDALDLSVRRPGVTHPLLRRLGPSPFPSGSFPIVGLLATCYELISEDAVRRGSEPAGPGVPEGGGDDQSPPVDDPSADEDD